MKQRPSRLELASRFFGEMSNATGADREQSKAYNLIVHELIICDLLGRFDDGWEKQGPGILCMDLRKGRPTEYKTLEVVMEVADAAKAEGDKATQELMDDAAKAIKELDFERFGLTMRVDHSSIVITHINRDNPTENIGPLIEELS
jgi:hypothetical protein|tara:strand:- start:1439 stop:1876 length:438 start_codon:yes stop_codon:yes gene_type:complete